MPGRIVFATAAFAALSLTATIAHAQAAPVGPQRPGSAPGWSVGVGGGAIISPDFRGASTYRVRPIPAVTARYGEDFAVTGLGASYTAMRVGPWQAGAQGRFRFGQKEDDNRGALRGLGDVGRSVELGGFVGYGQGPVKLKASFTHDFAGGHSGQVATLEASYTTALRRTSAGPVLLSINPAVTWTSGDFNRAYYGVDAGQSLRSGLAPYRPGSGLESAGLSMNVITPLSRRITFVAIAGYDRLIAKAADSPRIQERGSQNQATFIATVTYRLF